MRLNAPDAGVHDKMARVPGAFDQTIRGIALLREQVIPFAVRMRRHPQNEPNVEKARELANRAGAARFEIV